MSIERAYSEIVASNNLSRDPAQQNVVSILQRLQTELEIKPGRWQAVFSKIGIRLPLGAAPGGIYLWGGVGRGKTFLMDLFFETLDHREKRRIHFHRMMREIHDRLRLVGNLSDPLDKVAQDIASETRVLCFDEFFVSDIGDAMILGKLLSGLFKRGVTLIATSNSSPQNLYLDGLQRKRFEPAIALLERHTQVVELNSGVDYRFRLLQHAGTYLAPADSGTQRKLTQFFADIAPGVIVEGRVLDILGRAISTLRCAKGVAWFDFMEICDGPRSQNDYIEIARWYQTVIISDVPLLDENIENAARRFISLVDEFYDRRVKLILSAAASIDSLYQGSKLAFEFQRTVSRLTEMQSSEYLHKAHIP